MDVVNGVIQPCSHADAPHLKVFRTTWKDVWVVGIGMFLFPIVFGVMAMVFAPALGKAPRPIPEIFPVFLIMGGLSGASFFLLTYKGMQNVVVVGGGMIRVFAKGQVVAERKLSNYIRCYQHKTLKASNWIEFKEEPELPMPVIVLWRLIDLKSHLDHLKRTGQLGGDAPAGREMVIS